MKLDGGGLLVLNSICLQSHHSLYGTADWFLLFK